jgi:ribonuclease G
VIELLQEEESHHVAGLSDFIRKPISLMTEVGMGPEDYNIVLL